MSGNHPRSEAEQRWLEAMFADLQRQIDELAGELLALTYLVHAHTLASLKAEPAADADFVRRTREETDDGR
ncbi:hypothetical protein ACN27F_10625 [Solwaraspora sp. WMMB335]|uniref:hypothetical protein n=1 Tax=Solwaraspora sp. WMMB335 TaxID=3404118 RepID=UPI003B93C732